MSNKLGFDDTPFLPESIYHVNDDSRPQPRIVDTGTLSSAHGIPEIPPSDAVILFNGQDLSQWMSSSSGSQAKWKVENGYMEVAPQTGNIQTKKHFGDCQLHVEWAAPTVISDNGQFRGNSGVFLMGLYEVQILDCYNNQTYADGITAGIYGQYPPLVNACRRPGEWQIYDIIWEAPRFKEEKLVRAAYITILFNGVVVQNHARLMGLTPYQPTLPYSAHPPIGPLVLTNHGNPVRFRNIWYRPLYGHDQK